MLIPINNKKLKYIIYFLVVLFIIPYTFYYISSFTIRGSDKYNNFNTNKNGISKLENNHEDEIINDDEVKNINIIDINEKSNLTTTKEPLKHFVVICEEELTYSLETYEGYNIKCPVNYEIKIEKAFYGRHKNDDKTCNEDLLMDEDEYYVKEDENCGYDTKERLKKLCEGKRQCEIKVTSKYFGNPCEGRKKYMEIEYQCIPILKKKEPNFAIVMFSDSIKEKSTEQAIEEFKSYSNRYNYTFFLNSKVYDYEREIYYMKLYSLTEYIIKGLKEETYDWILWSDTDIALLNPNIELSAFLPPEDKDNVHLIISSDQNGFNAGVFLIHVHPWSLNLIMKASSYAYYKKNEILRFADQTAIRNVLLEGHEEKHYIVVPQVWFNGYNCHPDNHFRCIDKGDFLVHFAGARNEREEIIRNFRENIKDKNEWMNRTTLEMRKMALDYYNLPNEEQFHFIK